MNPLGLVPVGQLGADPAAIQFGVLNLLAAGQRLWFRGRLANLPPPSGGRHWWSRQTPCPPLARLAIQIDGQDATADLSVGSDGQLDGALACALPPARRNWRVARNRITVGDQALETTAVVAEPPEDAVGAVAVVLPPTLTSLDKVGSVGEPGGPLARFLQRLQRGPRGGHAIYYLVPVPAGRDASATERALALTAQGCPSGALILLPASPTALASAIDRLRWLLAGVLDLQVVNLDPDAAEVLARLPATLPDRAPLTLAKWDDLGKEKVRPTRPSSHPNWHRPLRHERVTRHPLVFCHGMLACTMLRLQLAADYNYFSRLGDALAGRGFRALYPLVTPTGGVAERAEQLRDQVVRWTDEPVNIIAHSMGGLDARYLISRLGMAGKVKSLTTISTPHRGSWVADWFHGTYRGRVPLLPALEAMGVNVDGFADCRRAACQALNDKTPDMPGVRYFSFAGDVPPGKVTPMLRRTWALLHQQEGANDGLVSVASARWGEFLGVVQADHFAQTPDAMWVRDREDFHSAAFFTHLVEDLARRGF